MLKLLSRVMVAMVAAAAGVMAVQSPALAATVGPVSIWQYQSQKCVDVPNGSDANVVMIIFTCREPRTANQSWTFISTDDGYWNIKNQSSGKCLTVRGASNDNSADVIQYACNTGDNEEWSTRYTGITATYLGQTMDYYNIINRKSGKCLTIKNGDTVNNTTLLQYTCNGGTNNLFSWAPQPRLHF